MNAQSQWKQSWKTFYRETRISLRTNALRGMLRFRREAALERMVEAQQRRIDQLQAELDFINSHAGSQGDEWEKEYYLRGQHR